MTDDQLVLPPAELGAEEAMQDVLCKMTSGHWHPSRRREPEWPSKE
jgi:hypothetical protein